MISINGLNLGRTQRLITTGLRRAVENRDGRTCWMPGCDCTHGLQGHHILHWALGGRTDLDNLILLCPFHHHLLHEGGWRMSHRRRRIEVRNRDGKLVHERPRPRTPKRRRTRGPECRVLTFEEAIAEKATRPITRRSVGTTDIHLRQ